MSQTSFWAKSNRSYTNDCLFAFPAPLSRYDPQLDSERGTSGPKDVETQAWRMLMNSLKTWTRVLAGGLSSLAVAGIALAQDSTSSSSSNTSTTTQVWYGQWWVWAVGVAIFLIVVIALTNRGGSNKT